MSSNDNRTEIIRKIFPKEIIIKSTNAILTVGNYTETKRKALSKRFCKYISSRRLNWGNNGINLDKTVNLTRLMYIQHNKNDYK